MQTHFATLCLWWLRSRCFPNPCQSDIWWLTNARRNSYRPVLVRIFRNCAIVEAWLLSWHVENVSMTYRICILRTSLSEVFCSWYMQIAVITSTTYPDLYPLQEFCSPIRLQHLSVVQSDCSIWKRTLKCWNLIGLQSSCSSTNPGIAMSPNLPLFCVEVGLRPTRPTWRSWSSLMSTPPPFPLRW